MSDFLKFGKWVLAAAAITLCLVPASAQRVRNSATQANPARGFHRQEVREQKRPLRQEARRNGGQKPPVQKPPSAERHLPATHNALKPSVNPNRPPSPNPGNSGRNLNRPPNASSSQGNPRRFRDLSPEDKQRVLQNQKRFNQLPPQRQQEMKDAARNWQRLTPQQQDHVKNDVLPKWKQLPPDRKRSIQQRLGVLKSMPESARNQHLDDPNFTRGMNEEDKSTLRDLSHLHVGGAPDPPSE